MAFVDDYEKQVSDNLRRLRLCSLVLEQVRQELLDPFESEKRADLLLEVEDLTSQTLELMTVVREMVWHEELKPAPEDS